MGKREEEIATGAVQGPFRISEVDLDSIVLHPSFPVWARKNDGGWKARNIENLKTSGGNGTVAYSEAYTPDGLDMARAVVRCELEMWGQKHKAGRIHV